MKIEMDKQYRTRDGREAKVLMVDAGTSHPVIAAHRDRETDIWWSLHFTAEGRVSESREDPRDLIEVKPRIKRTLWLNIYSNAEAGFTNRSREDADATAGRQRIACIPIEIDCEHGEGL